MQGGGETITGQWGELQGSGETITGQWGELQGSGETIAGWRGDNCSVVGRAVGRHLQGSREQLHGYTCSDSVRRVDSSVEV